MRNRCVRRPNIPVLDPRYAAWLYVRSQSLTRVCLLQIGQSQLSPPAGSTGFFSFGAAKSSVAMSIFLNGEQWSHSGQYATHLGILSCPSHSAENARTRNVGHLTHLVRFCDLPPKFNTSKHVALNLGFVDNDLPPGYPSSQRPAT